MGKGMRGKGEGMSGPGMGAVGMGCKGQPKEIEHRYRKHKNIVRECPATPSSSPKCHVQKDPHKNVVPRSPGVHIKRAACVAHAHREHTDELIGPCNYCGSFYAHSADMMKHHVNECAGSTTGSDDNDD